MNAKSLGWGRLLSAFVCISGHFTAIGAEVRFSAVVDQSPLTSPGYTVGSVVTGWFDYSTGTPPIEMGLNYTDYRISEMHLLLGAAEYNAGPTTVEIGHGIGINEIPAPADLYEVSGYSLVGPAVEGFGAAASTLLLVDTTASVYAANPPPYPVDLPDPNRFDSRTLIIKFYHSPGDLECTIQSITVIPEPNGFLLLGSGLSGLALACRKRAMRNHGLVDLQSGHHEKISNEVPNQRLEPTLGASSLSSCAIGRAAQAGRTAKRRS
jgi:hypothetical protein